jgi:Tfp pilus assembly protein PilF
MFHDTLAQLLAAHRHNEAELLCRQYLIHRPDDVVVQFNFGLILFHQQKFTEAVQAFRTVLSRQPHHADTLANLAAALINHHQDEAALYALKKTLQHAPTHRNALNNLKALANKQQQFTHLEQALSQALLHEPQNILFYIDLSDALIKQRRYAEAEQVLRPFEHTHAQHPALISHLALSILRQHRYREAQQLLQHCLSHHKNDHDCLVNYGAALYHAGDYHTACTVLEHAISLYQNEPDLHYYLALSLLSMGEFDRAWPHFHYRILMDFPHENLVQYELDLAECTPNQRIMVRAEQGFGDQIQFLRYVALLKQSGVMVMLEVPPGLLRLYEGLTYIDQIVVTGSALPEYDKTCFLMTLAQTFATETHNIPRETPYLSPSASLSLKWSNALQQTSGFRIALTWATGRPHDLSGSQRSLALSCFATLAQLPQVSLISIQKGSGASQIQYIDFPILHLGGAIQDFADTAAILGQVDLLISVDTSVAHLAGALKIPTWVILPQTADWRWLPHETHSDWYPNMRLFKKDHQDWTAVMSRIKQALIEKISTDAQYVQSPRASN